MSLTCVSATAIQKTHICTKWKLIFIYTFLAVFSVSQVSGQTRITENNCEVCVKYIRKFVATISEDVKKSPVAIENAFKDFCAEAVGKDERFCYYIGGARDSATYILGVMSKPISWSMPVENICEKLSKMDSQVCSLRYDKQIDLETVDLKKLKVRDLKKVLDNWGEMCSGCIEKDEFIKKIEELKPKYMRSEL